MPTLNQINVNQNGGQVVLSLDTTPVIEPIGGPLSIDRLMDRFPETVYNKSRDSHLYRLVSAFCGEAGMGRVRKKALLARLKNEAGLINFNDIDAFYGSVLDFKRLKREIYNYNPEDDALEKEVWDKIHAMDNSYKKRVVLFLQSTRYGNAPRGIELAAEAAAGINVDLVENYRYLFDIVSDDPLGLTRVGNTENHEEFVLIPQAIDNRHNVAQTVTLNFTGEPDGGNVILRYADLQAQINFGDSAETVRNTLIDAYGDILKTFEIIRNSTGEVVAVDEAVSVQFFSESHVNVIRNSDFQYEITINDPNINIFNFSVISALTGGTNPAATLSFPLNNNFYIATFAGPNPLYINALRRTQPITDDLAPWKMGNTLLIEPEIERNMVKIVDKLRPVNTVMTVKAQTETRINVRANKVQASSERISVNRFVTGKNDVEWPSPGDAASGTFIQGRFVVTDSLGNQDVLNLESEATTLAYGARAIPVIYHTIDSVAAYRDAALGDPDYNTNRFFGGSLPAFAKYRSIAHAPYNSYQRVRLPTLAARTDGDDIFFDYFALAKPNTPLILGT